MNRKQITVLLIEDNPGDARLTQEMLAEARGLRCDLESTDTLDAGLQRIAQGGIDLVLLDLGLPDSSGIDTLLRLRSGIPPSLTVLVMTGRGRRT
jgi:DNA-binding response OmpR family regulator